MNSTGSSPVSRRKFCQTSVAAGALAAAPWAVRAATSANDAIRVGFIGTGGRGTALMGELMPLAGKHNLQVVALCDVWRKNLDAASLRVRQKLGAAPRTFTRFRELLALPDVDAVVIATPDFSHGEILVAALEAGKDVYIEKPMTIDLPSANRALDEARRRERVVQVGTQRRSDGLFRAAAERVASGVLGRTSRVTAEVNFNHARWIRPMEDCVAADVDWEAFLLRLENRPFDAALLRRWQLHRETSNGLPGLWMTHYADAVHLLTACGYPTRATALGGTYVWKDEREHTDTFHALVEYPEGFLFSWGMGLGNAAGRQFSIHGTEGTLDVEKATITPEAGAKSAPPAGKISPLPGTGHMENWVTCLRSRARPNAAIEYGHQHVVATVMCALALQSGRTQVYDPEQRSISHA